MELINEYLEKAQRVGDVYILRVDPEDCTEEEMMYIHEGWQKVSDDPLLILPFQFDISAQSEYSFYVAMMLVGGNMTVTRKKWIQDAAGDIKRAKRVRLENKQLMMKWGKDGLTAAFLVDQDDMDADDYVLVERNK
jgi:hypothetical protein